MYPLLMAILLELDRKPLCATKLSLRLFNTVWNPDLLIWINLFADPFTEG